MSAQEVIDIVACNPGVLQCTLSDTDQHRVKVLVDAGKLRRQVVCLLSTRKAAYTLFIDEENSNHERKRTSI